MSRPAEIILESEAITSDTSTTEKAVFQKYRTQLNQCENIDRIDAAPRTAFEAFEGREIFPRTSGHNSYYEHEASQDRLLETPLAKFSRLRSELSELLETLSDLEKDTTNKFWENVKKEATKLVSESEAMKLSPAFEAIKRQASSSSNELSFIVQEIRNIRLSTVQFQARAPVDKSSSISQFTDLEKRVSRLERMIGVNAQIEGDSKKKKHT